MYFTYTFLIALGALQAAASALPRVKLGRALPSCTHDDLYRIFLDARYSASASSFCSVYIESTSMATATSTPIDSTTTSATATATVITTDVETLTSTETTISETSTVTTTITDTTTTNVATITVTPPAAKKRSGQASISPPGLAGTYPPSRLSSACSCLVTPSTVVQTVTTQGATSTAIDTVSVTISTTSTISTELIILAAASTTITDTATSTVNDVVLATPTYYEPAAYCSQSCLGKYEIQCGGSYIDVSSGFFVTTDTYTDCANACSADGYCFGFSFVLGSTTNNCWITGAFYVIEGGAPVPDNGVNSGEAYVGGCY